jgi:maltooligosyltrehalose trehalohydrolase
MSDGRLRVAAALLLTTPFVPMLFQGEEWGASTPFQYFTDHLDPGLGRAVSEGRRREFAAFGWDPADVPDPQDAATFRRCRLDWDETRRGPHAGLLAWHRRLIALRREIPALTDPRLGRAETEYDENAGWLVIRRRPIVIASNLGSGTWIFPAAPSAELLAASSPGAGRTRRGIVLPPDTVAILTEASAS